MPHEGSVTLWLTLLRAGDDTAAHHLWDRYFQELAALARRKLGPLNRVPADEEDVALSALKSLWRGMTSGHFDDLADRGDLWRLLATLTDRKAAHRRRDERRRKRGGGWRRLPATALGPLASPEPTPAFVVEVADECRRLLDLLDAPILRPIALARLEGYSVEEIAARFDISTSTCKRQLRRIRKLWQQEATA